MFVTIIALLGVMFFHTMTFASSATVGDFSIEILSNASAVEPGEAFTYVVRVTNSSETPIEKLKINVEFDDNVEFLTATHDGEGGDRGTRWNDIDLGANTTREFRVGVRVLEDARHDESIDSIVYANGAMMQHSLRVLDPMEGKESVQLTAFVDKVMVSAGDRMTFTIRIHNLENRDERLDVRAELSHALTLMSASSKGQVMGASVIQWDDLLIDEDESVSLTFSARVPEDMVWSQLITTTVTAGSQRATVTLNVVAPTSPEETVASNSEETATPAVEPISSVERPDTVAIPQTGGETPYWWVPVAQASEPRLVAAVPTTSLQPTATVHSPFQKNPTSLHFVLAAASFGLVLGLIGGWKHLLVGHVR